MKTLALTIAMLISIAVYSQKQCVVIKESTLHKKNWGSSDVLADLPVGFVFESKRTKKGYRKVKSPFINGHVLAENTSCEAEDVERIGDPDLKANVARKCVLKKNKNGEYEHIEVIEAEGFSADELQRIIKSWIAITYVSANDVIQLDDPVSNKVIAKGVYGSMGMLGSKDLRHTLLFDFKDNKLRMKMNGFYVMNGEGSKSELTSWNSFILSDLGKMIPRTVQEIKMAINDSESSANDDW